jgi:hypothetical protein
VKVGRAGVEIFCADQREISPRFQVGETEFGAFQSSFDELFFPAPVSTAV